MQSKAPSMKDVRRISGIALWVSDLERTAAFYRDVIGVPLVYSDAHEPKNIPHYETMWNGDGRTLDQLDWSKEGPSEPSLWLNLYPAQDKPTSSVELSFPVPNLEEVHRRANKWGAKMVSELRDTPWDGREFIIEDPDGNQVAVTGE